MVSSAGIDLSEISEILSSADFLMSENLAVVSLLVLAALVLLSSATTFPLIAESIVLCFIPRMSEKITQKSGIITTFCWMLMTGSVIIFSIATTVILKSDQSLCLMMMVWSTAVLLARWIVLKGIGHATGERELTDSLTHLLSSNIILTGITSSVFLFITILLSATSAILGIVYTIAVAFLIINYVFAEIRTFRMFQSSLFCSFLYLCTLDFLPVATIAACGLLI